MIPANTLALAGSQIGQAGFSVNAGIGIGTSVSKVAFSPANAYAGWQFLNDATTKRMSATSYSLSSYSSWGTPSGGTPGNDYEIKCTVNSGTTPSGSSTGVWLPLSSTVQWYLFETGESSKTCNLTIAIRDAATQTEQGSRTTTITATVSY